jgi:hypothetical protein
MSLFNGHILPSSSYVALQRITLAFNIGDVEILDHTRLVAHAMLLEPKVGTTSNANGRTWWHAKKIECEYWVSINPGEFRTEPPERPCSIKEIPDDFPFVPIRQMLQDALAACSSVLPVYEEELRVMALAARLLARDSKPSLAPILDAIAHNRAQIADKHAFDTMLARLYEEYLFEGVCTVDDFSIVLLLFQLPYQTGRAFDYTKVAHPRSFLANYIRRMLSGAEEANVRLRFAKVASQFRVSGREMIRAALDGTMSGMSRKLGLAIHLFTSANAIVDGLQDAGVKDLPYPPNLGSESFACTNSAINLGAEFFFAAPDGFAKLVRAEVANGRGTLQSLEKHHSSEFEPTFTRNFAKILTAQAETLSDDGIDTRRGASALKTFLDEHWEDAQMDMETEWAEHALGKAYLKLDERDAAEEISLRIAKRRLERSFGSSSN